MRKPYVLSILLVTLLVCLPLVAQGEPMERPLQWTSMNLPGSGTPINDISPSPHDSNRVLIAGQQSGVSWSDDRGTTWHAANGFSCFQVNSFVWHPVERDVVWAATMNGVYVSRDSGESWERKSEGMPIDAFSEVYTYLVPVQTITIDPVNRQRMLAFCGVRDNGMGSRARSGGVWETKDGGERWHKLCTITREGATDDENAKGVSIISASFAGKIPMLVYAASNEAGFFESTDGGVTWTRRVTGLPHDNVIGMQVDPKKTDVAWLHLGIFKDVMGEGEIIPGGIYKTISGGLGWFSVSRALPQIKDKKERAVTGFQAIAVAPSDSRIVYACDSSIKSGIIYKSIDGAKSWKALATQKHPESEQTEEQKALFQVTTFLKIGLSDLRVMVIDPKNPDIVYAGGASFAIRSEDGGKTWQEITSTVVKDTSWQGTGLSGLDVTDFIWNPDKKGHMIVSASNAAKFMETQDGGKTWQLRGADPYAWGGGASGCFAGDRIYLGTGQYGVFGSVVRFDGTQWKTLTGKACKLPQIRRCGQVTSVFSSKVSPLDVYAVIGGRIYKSSNGGDEWKLIDKRRDLGWITAVPGSKSFYVSGQQNSFYVSAGKSFRTIGGPKEAGRLACDPEGNIYLAARKSMRSGLWRFSKGKWVRLLDESYVADVAVDSKNPKRIAVCTAGVAANADDVVSGIWISDDGGIKWANVNKGLVRMKATAISFDPHDSTSVLLGTAGAGVYRMKWPVGHDIMAFRQYASTGEDSSFSKKVASTGARNPFRPGDGTTTGVGGRRSPLRNGDMELGNTMPSFWTNRWVGKGNVVVARDATTSSEGEASLRIQTVGGSGKGQISQIMDAKGISKVTLSASVKAEGKVFAQIAVQSFDAQWKSLQYKTIKYFRKPNKWTPIKGTAKLPAGTVRFGIGLLIDGDGKAWMDDVKVEVE